MTGQSVTDKISILQQGADLLASALTPHGFRFFLRDSGRSSGGTFAHGEFVRDAWRLELHFRYSLGLVAYHSGIKSLSHEDYVWSVTGHRSGGAYPGFSDDPLDGFRFLRRDLEEHCLAFLRGDEAEFERLVQATEERSKRLAAMSGFQKMSL